MAWGRRCSRGLGLAEDAPVEAAAVMGPAAVEAAAAALAAEPAAVEATAAALAAGTGVGATCGRAATTFGTAALRASAYAMKPRPTAVAVDHSGGSFTSLGLLTRSSPS